MHSYEILNEMKDTVDKVYPNLVNFCQEIIRIPSLSGEEKEVAKAVTEELKKLGYDDVFCDDWGNVSGIVYGTEPGPTIMYNGHMDVVTEGNHEDWEGYDPYGGEIDESMVQDKNCEKEELAEVIHGRGASDMKCGLAAQIYTGAVLALLKKKGFKWKENFLLSAVVLEENGEMMGTIKLTEETLPAKKINVDGMVCAEPSSLKLMLGHRGRAELRITVTGQSCHGSSPWLGINAAEKAAKLVLEIEKFFSQNKKENPKLGQSGITLTMIENKPNALCIVPDECILIYDRRLVPEETVAEAIAQIQSIIDKLAKEDPDFKATVEINSNERTSYTGKSEWIESQKEAWIIEEEHPFIKACARALESIGEEVEFGYWPFSTDIPQVGVRMKKPVVGYSGGQEIYIHNPYEKIRTDYLKKSLLGNIAMFLELSELPIEEFTV